MMLLALSIFLGAAQAEVPNFNEADAQELAQAARKELDSCPAFAKADQIELTEISNRTDQHIDKTIIFDALGKALSKDSKRAVTRLTEGQPKGYALSGGLEIHDVRNGKHYQISYFLNLSLKKGKKELCSKKMTIERSGDQT